MAVRTARNATLCPGRSLPTKNVPGAEATWWRKGTGLSAVQNSADMWKAGKKMKFLKNNEGIH